MGPDLLSNSSMSTLIRFHCTSVLSDAHTITVFRHVPPLWVLGKMKDPYLVGLALITNRKSWTERLAIRKRPSAKLRQRMLKHAIREPALHRLLNQLQEQAIGTRAGIYSYGRTTTAPATKASEARSMSAVYGTLSTADWTMRQQRNCLSEAGRVMALRLESDDDVDCTTYWN
jgi:hypothetical protein